MSFISVRNQNIKIAAEYYQKLSEFKSVEGLQYKDICQHRYEFWDKSMGVPEFHNNILKFRWVELRKTHDGGSYPMPCSKPEVLENAKVVYFPRWSVEFGACAGKAVIKYSDGKKAAVSGVYHLTEQAAIEHAIVLYGVRYGV